MKKVIKPIVAVVCAMFGVRSSKGLDEDRGLSVGTILVTGLLLTVLFIFSIIGFIKFVVLA